MNDLTFALETGGIVGLFAYIFMLSIASKLWISHDLLVRFKASLCPSDYGIARSVLDAQQAFMSLTVLLIVLFEFDDTAFWQEIFSPCYSGHPWESASRSDRYLSTIFLRSYLLCGTASPTLS